jgi:hypothetical protein
MLLLDHFCRVNHINLVLPSLAVNAYQYEAPVTLQLIVTW